MKWEQLKKDVDTILKQRKLKDIEIGFISTMQNPKELKIGFTREGKLLIFEDYGNE